MTPAELTPFARLLAYVRRLPGQFAAGAVLTIAYAILFQAIPRSVRNIVAALESDPLGGEVHAAVYTLAAVSVVYAAVRLGSRMFMFRAGRELEYRIRNDYFAQLQRLPQSFFLANRTGDLMSRAVNDINAIRLFLGMGLLNIVQTPVLYVLAIAMMLYTDPILTGWVILPYPLFIGIARIFGHRMFSANLAAQEQLGVVSTAVQENASGVSVVRTYGLEDEECERFESKNAELYKRAVRVAFVQATMQPLIGLLPVFATVMVVFMGGLAVTSGRLVQADLWLFYTYIGMLTFPTFMLGFVINQVQRGLAALHRIGEVFDTVPSIRERDDTLDIDRIGGSVRFRGLSFAYPGFESRPALRDVSLDVQAGQTIGLVGAVGAGKSTLLSVIPRLLEVEDGTVVIDGHELNRLPLHTLRASIAMVPQDSFLFSSTVADNIAFGCPDASEEEIREAARRAHILEDIETELPNGFQTTVGERGVTMSGGQRQRVALARALMLDPAILILDDSLSSVDHATEEAILKDLRTATAGRTCFIAAHRLTAVRDADLIVVLEEGRISESGSHAELMENEGFYARLYRQQQLEAELEEEDVA